MFQKFTLTAALLIAALPSVSLSESGCSISDTQAQIMAVQLIKDTKNASDFEPIEERIDSFLSLESSFSNPECAVVAEELNGAARIATALIAQKSIENNQASQF